MPKITCIPATINQITKLPHELSRKRKTCGYARVSTDKDEQFTSYEAQIDYYTKYITKNPDWEFVKVYTDEGISGTSIKNRDGFNTMIQDALDGKIDLIVTKSVSRFARNTVDTLSTIRKLKDRGVEVYFEKENIWSFDSKGELVLTIMSSIAQEESRSISENITWSKRKQAAEGKFNISTNRFIGYDKDENGNLIINEEEAKIVRRIFTLFLNGKTTGAIAKELERENIPTASGKGKWRSSSIYHMLTNEKYKGDVITQKTYTVDFLTHRVRKNRGEVPMYYVEGNHAAIIPPNEWERVQAELKRRNSMLTKYSGKQIFSSKIICADCGSFYGPKVWNSNNEKYRRVIWQCNNKFKNQKRCATPHLNEEDIMLAFVKAFNLAFHDRLNTIADMQRAKMLVTDTTALDKEKAQLLRKVDDTTLLIRNLINRNATYALDPEEFKSRYLDYANECESYQERIKAIDEEIALKKDKATNFEHFIGYLSNTTGALDEFAAEAWNVSLDIVKVSNDGKLTFVFKNGASIII